VDKEIAVSFDLWFTLIWEDDEGAREYLDRRIGVLYDWFNRFTEVGYDDLRKYYKLTDHIRMITPIPQLIRYISLMVGLNIGNDVIEKIAKAYIKSTANFRPNVVDEAGEVLENLKDNEVKVGILTNTSFNEWGVRRLLRNVGLDKYVDAVVSSCDIGFVKPSPEAFQILIRKLGVSPQKLYHVGDTYLDDVVGALNLGANGILFTGLWKYYQLYGPYRNRPQDVIRANIPVVNSLKRIYNAIW